MKILYVARNIGSENNGANQVMSRNLSVLKELIGENNLQTFNLPKSTIKNVLNSLFHIGSYGVPNSTVKDLNKVIKSSKPDLAFIESSSNGSIVKKISKLNIKTICFAHNVDFKLSLQELRSRSPLISIPKIILTYINEKRCSKHVDKLICLTERDSCTFFRLFNRKADIILPITFPIKPYNKSTIDLSKPSYFLFVGSNFFPNIEGISWFIKNVAPFVHHEFRIVGSCCNSLQRMNTPENVKLIGYAEDLEKEYRNAIGVIAPIFKGSGMKTKTVEALSYGKSVIGTTEAFTGIDIDFDRIGGKCNNAEDFIKILNTIEDKDFNEYAYQVFINRFSNEYFKDRLKGFIN